MTLLTMITGLQKIVPPITNAINNNLTNNQAKFKINPPKLTDPTEKSLTKVTNTVNAPKNASSNK